LINSAPRPRWQKVLADLWGSRTRTLLVIASISVGLFAFGIIATIYWVIASDMRTAYGAVNAANIYLQVDLFDLDLVENLRKLEGVRQAEGVRSVSLRVFDRDAQWQTIRFQAVKDWDEMPINTLRMVEGNWPPEKNELVVDQYKRDELGAALGELVTIELADGKTRELKLVGVVQDLTVGAFSGGGGFFEAPVQGYVHQDTMDTLGQPMPYLFNGLYVTVDEAQGDDVSAIRAVAERVTDRMEDNDIVVISTRPVSSHAHPNGYLIDAIVGVLLVLGLLVVFLSGFLITSTLQALLNQQVQQIGIMKSVGARRVQIAGIYMMLILLFGLISYVVAVPLAAKVSFWLMEFLARMLNFVFQGERVVLPVVILQGVLALIMPQVAAWQPIWKGTQISVQEALNGIQPGAGQGKAHHDPQAKRAARRPKLISRPMLISIRNTFRRKGRLILTLVTLTLGGGIFIATFNVQVSMNKYIDQIARYFISDVNVTLDRPYRISQVQELLDDVPGVKYVEGWATASSQILLSNGSAGESVSLLAPPAGSSLVEPVVLDGRWIKPGDSNAIVLSDQFTTRFPNLRVGDTLDLQVNGDETEWVVVGFFQFAGKNGGYIAYTSFDFLSELVGLPNKAITFQVVADREGLSAEEQNKLSLAIESRLEKAGLKVTDLTTGSSLSGIAGSGFNILILFLLFLAVLTAMVGSIGLAGTMSMNVMERTREIGVMRAIGASDRILMKMVLVEGLIIGAISYVAGSLLAFPISKLMSDGISLAIFDAPSSFGFTPIGFGIWAAAVALLSLAASLIPARRASRLTIREVLAYE